MALRDQPYLPLYVQDFLSDEKLNECSAESTGVYIRLMCVMHKSQTYGQILLKQKDKQNESTIKNFAFKLARQMPYSVAVIEHSLVELIEEKVIAVEGDVLFQKRMVNDGKLSDIRALAAKSRKEGSKTEANPVEFASDFAPAKSGTNSESENESENENEIKRKRDSAGREKESLMESFESFWSAYPRKAGKGAARQRWLKLRPNKKLTAKIIAAVEKQKGNPQWQKDNGQFIPYPATWLNQERWEDVPSSNFEGSSLPKSYDIEEYEANSVFDLPEGL